MQRAALLLLLAPVLAGCTSFELTRLRNDVAREAPGVEVGTGYAVAFGALTMGTARTALALGDDADDGTRALRAFLRNVRRVQFGRYDVRGTLDGRQVGTPDALRRYERRGWTPVAVVRDSASATWVYALERDGELCDLLVVALSPRELTLAKASGNLSAAVVEAARASDLRSLWRRDTTAAASATLSP